MVGQKRLCLQGPSEPFLGMTLDGGGDVIGQALDGYDEEWNGRVLTFCLWILLFCFGVGWGLFV